MDGYILRDDPCPAAGLSGDLHGRLDVNRRLYRRIGLRQTPDTVGAFLGPVIAVFLMWLTADNIPLVFWFAVIPVSVSVFVLLVFVPEPEPPAGLQTVQSPLDHRELKRLGGSFWWEVAVASVFTLARFSEPFLILKAVAEGIWRGSGERYPTGAPGKLWITRPC